MINTDVFRRLGLAEAVARELSLRNRLLPPRWDHLALADHHQEVEVAIRPLLRRGPSGVPADVVLSDKGWRGVRPLHVMSLTDRVLFRALVDLISENLPDSIRQRVPFSEFNEAPLGVQGTRYVCKADVTAYYEFVDHGELADELVAQTGEEPAVEALMEVLSSVLGRRVGLPQVHKSSDVLGDTFIDIIRRRLRRRGYIIFTYSDDFRLAASSLGNARAALEACAQEVRALGLVLNERKTYTYRSRKYRESLTSYIDAERELFANDRDHGSPSDAQPSDLGFPDSSYDDADEVNEPSTFGAEPLDRGIDEDEALDDIDLIGSLDSPSERRVRAARQAWEIWSREDESEETQARQEAAITQSLLGRALPTLAMAGDDEPLDTLSQLMRYEPALAPQVASYLTAYAENGVQARARIRRALDEIANEEILSPWQAMWLAQAAGGIRRSRREHPYEEWLASMVTDSQHPGLAATSAAALGRLGRGDDTIVAAALDRVGPAWRLLAFWGLIGLNRSVAADVADNKLERLLLEVTE